MGDAAQQQSSVRIDKQTIAYSVVCFLIPFTLFAFTRSSSLMFDDAAEFALVIKLASIAHPPGTPAYIFTGMVWDKLLSLFSRDTISILTLFSAFSVAFGSFLFYLALKTIAHYAFPSAGESKTQLASSLTAVVFATGATTWAWGNTVEVYAFQVLVMSIMFFGLVKFHFHRSTRFMVIASLGYALGLANHHVEAVFFAPLIPLFFMEGLFAGAARSRERGKKTKESNRRFFSEYFAVFRMPAFWMMVGITTVLTGAFYFWMYWRAQQDYPFMFGQPNTLDLLWYHIRGGTYGKNLQTTSERIRLVRVQYFLTLTFFQYLAAFPLVLYGLYELYRKRLYRLISLSVLLYIFMLIYQLNNNQWSSTDAYMLIPFFMLTIPVLYGVLGGFDKLRMKVIVPIMLIVSFAYNLPLHNRRNYNISDSLLHLMDESAPKNSVVLISDWSLVIQYYYARIVENFRPDLIVLNYDIKFTHYKILPELYPEFYRSIKQEYDQFIVDLGAAHPEQIYGTGCDLNSPYLLNSFKRLVNKIEDAARSQQRPFLTDPKAHFFFSQQKIYTGDRYVAGCFVASIATVNNERFLEMKEQWLDSPLLLHDPAALDKLVDFQAMLDSHARYFTSIRDSVHLEMAMVAQEKIMGLQNEMKKEMSFAYEVK